MTHPGVTLLELLVVLMILGLLAGVVGLSWRNDPWIAPTASGSEEPATVLAARGEAIESGRSVTTVVHLDGREVHVTALPDGRVLGAEALGFDPLSGSAPQPNSSGHAISRRLP